MAGNGESGFEMKAHQKDYGKFLWLFKWGTIASVIVAAIVVLLIAN
jgi:hypothetical protein